MAIMGMGIAVMVVSSRSSGRGGIPFRMIRRITVVGVVLEMRRML